MMDGAVYDAFPAAAATLTTTLAAALATGAASTSSSPPSGMSSTTSSAVAQQSGSDGDKGECRLLGSFALFVQLALGALALTSLVYKRWRERPQRPLKIWFFDASKQVFGSVLVHMANVFMSMLTSGRFSVTVEPAVVATAAAAVVRRVAVVVGSRDEDGYTPNPCSFYLLNLAIDTTVGIPILILLLRIFTYLVSFTPMGNPPESIQSGNYGTPPKAWWWLKQSLIYFCGLFGMKLCVLVIFILFPWISRVGDWALGWTEGNEKVQIVFVMMLFPLIMNALQYYIIDSFIKKQADKADTEGHDGSGGSASGGGSGASYHRIAPDEGLEGEEGGAGGGHGRPSEDEDEGALAKARLGSQIGNTEYDPEVDGDRTAARGGSSRDGPEGTLPKELVPKE
ncbi:unnamed protein product [Discula destructiva]